LAGLEAGAKMFVPWEDEPFGSLAHTVIADQKRRRIVCARNRTVEDRLNIDISLLPFCTSEMRDITRLRNLSLLLIAKRAPQLLPPGIRLNEEQACYQRDRHSYFLHCNHHVGQHSRNPEH
jgi:hypothetical protein